MIVAIFVPEYVKLVVLPSASTMDTKLEEASFTYLMFRDRLPLACNTVNVKVDEL